MKTDPKIPKTQGDPLRPQNWFDRRYPRSHKPAHTRHNPQNLADPTFQMFCCDFKKLEKHLSMVAPVKKHFIRKQEGAINSRVLLFLLLRKKQGSIEFNVL